MTRYKKYTFIVFFCICALFSTSFFQDTFSTKKKFGLKQESNIVLLSSKTMPTSSYGVLTQTSVLISILESTSSDFFIDLPKMESYFIRFFEEKTVKFQKFFLSNSSRVYFNSFSESCFEKLKNTLSSSLEHICEGGEFVERVNQKPEQEYQENITTAASVLLLASYLSLGIFMLF